MQTGVLFLQVKSTRFPTLEFIQFGLNNDFVSEFCLNRFYSEICLNQILLEPTFCCSEYTGVQGKFVKITNICTKLVQYRQVSLQFLYYRAVWSSHLAIGRRNTIQNSSFNQCEYEIETCAVKLLVSIFQQDKKKRVFFGFNFLTF